MVYSAKNAKDTFLEYISVESEKIKYIDDTNDRGLELNLPNGEGCVIFLYPISHKADDSKNFFDTRDSGARERNFAWDYALKHGLKYFCFAVNNQVGRYQDFIFSLECNESVISEVSGTLNGKRNGSGTQVVIPNDWAPQQAFHRIKTKNNFYIAAIRKDYIFDYMQIFDNRPYMDRFNVDLEYTAVAEPIWNEARQRIFFGAPGTGKSYSLNEEAKSLVSNKCEHIERVTFHPDYTYANFVGSYKPVMKQSDIVCSDDDSKEILLVLKDTTKTTQEKYDALYERFKSTGNLTRIPMILGLYSDDEFETRKADGTKTSDNNSVERNHGRALRKYVQLLSEESCKEKIAYEYVPGPFIRLLVKALQNPSDPYVLIVEEINRANVAAVFGDVFQLLDRNNDGESEYSITTTADMRVYLQHELGKDKDVTTIKIPSNMFIWATMNSADQGVYPMDTAFKRRWTFSYYGLDDGETKLSDVAIQPQFTLGKSSKLIAWNSLRKAINDELSTDTYNINEDKLMGPFFLKEEALKDDTSFNEAFKNKVLMYLFDDVVKQKRRSFFNCENSNRYSSVCNAFDLKGIKIFPDGVVNSKWLQEAEPVTSEDDETKATKV